MPLARRLALPPRGPSLALPQGRLSARLVLGLLLVRRPEVR
jgi:hypothetical protein